MEQYVCYSGGAQGSDLCFEMISSKFNVKVVAYSFLGHKTTSENTRILHKEELLKADESLKKVNKILKRNFPSENEYTNNLLRRNYYQILDTEAVFAISEIVDDLVQGGTGWACHMAIMNNIPTYVFDQRIGKWFLWKDNQFVEYENPILTEKFTGIGTRDINDAGIKAIKQLFKRSFGSKKNN